MKSITFCIATAKNEKDYIQLLLRSLQDNTQIENHEIIVFIDSDNQNTYEFLLEQKKFLSNLKICKNQEDFRIGSQRNISIMFNRASNEIVCYLQSDMVVGKDFDKHIIDNLNSKNIVLTCARIEPPIHPPSDDKITKDFGITPDKFEYNKFNSFIDNLQNENRQNIKAYFAPFSIYKETWFEVLGGFDTQFRCSREDSDITLRMKIAKLETIQNWNACVYHFTCVSSRGSKWFEKNDQSDKKNFMQSKADEQEVKRFIRKWGYFGHDYNPKYDTTLYIDIDTAVDINLLKQIEPYFNKIVINDELVVKQLKYQLDFDSNYYANKKWNYTSEYWQKVKNLYNTFSFEDKIIYSESIEKFQSDVIIKCSMYELIHNLSNIESIEFIQNNNTILSQLQSDGIIQTGDYTIGCFTITVYNLRDLNKNKSKVAKSIINEYNNYEFI